MNTSECDICVEKYNKTNRAKVICICEYEACRSCIKTYLLDKKEETHCLNCKVKWDRNFMSKNFERTFMSKIYKNHREEILFERELGMLEATQPYVEREIKIEKLKLKMEELRISYENEMKMLEKEYVELTNCSKIERKKFIRKCPNNNCHGFLSSGLKCELCDFFACSECREITGKTTDERNKHKCNNEIVESIKMLEKDSKPCPKCASMTFKIIGCNQMFCVECHTPWDWSTGKIENGQIHNPHYIEYLAKQNKGTAPRNPLDVICGREIDNNLMIELMKIFPRKLKKDWYEVTNSLGQLVYYNYKTHTMSLNFPFEELKDVDFVDIAREIIHIRSVERPRFQETDYLEKNMQLRIAYMRNKLDKETFKSYIQKKEKDNEKKREISNLLDMYINCMTDIFYRFLDDPKKEKTIKVEIEKLRVYTNNCFFSIGKSFNSKIYEISKDFVFK
jgi:hypothetical protein